MKTYKLLAAAACFVPAMLLAKDTTPTCGVENIKLGGYVGQRIDQCIERRIMGQNADELVAPFRQQNETRGRWASEFWGKWVQGAIASYQYNHAPALLAKIRDAEQALMACQLPNGFLGDYTPDTETTGWDVWGRKYTLLGLLKWYRLSGDKQALKSACRLLDYTLSQVGPAPKKAIFDCGHYKGMPPMSILEPVMFMYNETKDERYLAFAKYIVEAGESADGPQLIARAEVPVSQRFPLKEGAAWYGRENGQKAYEMMSCYVGMLELYKVTGDERLLRAAETSWQHIADEEIYVVGSGASHECWYGGREKQTLAAARTMETCVTFTWMQFCERLLQLTGKAQYADALECTMYNALMASMKFDGSQIVKYVPVEGYRREGEHQCDVRINCCNANGPRAFATVPRVVYQTPSPQRLNVNLYIPSEATIQVDGQKLTIVQETNFPEDGLVKIRIAHVEKAKKAKSQPAPITLALRIPAWSRHTSIRLNGERVPRATAGTYYQLSRQWKEGDELQLTFDMTARILRQAQMAAVTRGPIILARDSRFRDGDIDECLTIADKEGVVELKRVEAPEHMWMAFELPVMRGYYHDKEIDQVTIHLCDFASAGNTWDETERYRLWLPLLYVPF